MERKLTLMLTLTLSLSLTLALTVLTLTLAAALGERSYMEHGRPASCERRKGWQCCTVECVSSFGRLKPLFGTGIGFFCQ